MNQALDNDRLATRQKLIDAYRAQLGGIQERLQTNWNQAAADLAAMLDELAPAAVFAHAEHEDLADAILCYDAAGKVVYPDSPSTPHLPSDDAAWRQATKLERTDPAAAAAAFADIAEAATTPEVVARALQAEARTLLRAGDRRGALAIVTGSLQEPALRDARDRQGRWIVPNAQLMALEIAHEIDPAAADDLQSRLQTRLQDYTNANLAASQRRFLGRELQRLMPGSPMPRWLAAEILAADYLAANPDEARDPGLRPAPIANIWENRSSDGRVVLLHRGEKLPARLRSILGPSGLPTDLKLDFLPPGHESEGNLLSLPAGNTLPGWRLVLSPKDPEFFATAASARAVSYAWIVGLVVLTIVVFAALAWGLVRRQVALTQLRNDLVANVTHELKTPLASMRLLVDTLLDSPQLDEKTTREYLQLIATENLRLSRLIGNFLTFSRIERNKYQFEFQETSPEAIAEQAAAAVRDRLDVPGCRFEVVSAAGLPAIHADADALVTALLNLLDNAWKYSGDEKEITLSTRALDGHVTFAVQDHGLGLSPRDRDRIFGRFQQAHNHRSTGGGGVGLGLSIVQFIVSAHRGSVTVDSEPGRGSTFTITLPAVDAKDARST